ncbi:MAG: BatA domain-containing protein [bacterium]
MNITFLNPSFLWGLPVVAIPILIHLLSKRRPITYQFSSVKFIQLASTTLIIRFKLKQLILLILRSLILLLLTLLFARPMVRRMPLFAQAEGVSRSSVILIDNSYSMGYVQEGESRFALAKKVARRVLKMTKRSDRAALFLLSDEVKPLVSYLTDDRQILLEKLEEGTLSFRPTNLFPGISQAYKILQESGSPNREIILITDLGINGWQGIDGKSIKEFDPEVKFIIIDLNRESLSNVAVSKVDCGRLTMGETSEISAKIRNYSKEKISRLFVSVCLEPQGKFQIGRETGEKIGQGFIDLTGGEEGSKDFFYNFPGKGTYLGKVEIQEDSLPCDDRFYFKTEASQKIRVLLIDGDPGISSFSSETFYLTLSLSPTTSEVSTIQSPLAVKVVTPDAFSQERLDDFSVIFLANVGKVTNSLRERLTNFVREGGGVVFSLGDNVNGQEYNLNFGNLLPAELMGVKEKSKEEGKFTAIDFQDFTHPILQVFAGGKEGDLTGTRFYQYFATQAKPWAKVILGLADGLPLLIEGKLPYPKAGKILLFASTLDRDWNNLPAKPVFLPLIQQIVRYLALSTLREEPRGTFLVGEEMRYGLGRGEELPPSVEIIDPRGKKFSVIPVQKRDFSGIEFGPVEIPGIYRLSYIANGRWNNKYLSVNLNIESNESNMTKMGTKEIKRLFLTTPIKIIEDLTNLEKEILQLLYGKEISKNLIFLLVGFLFLEVFLANPRGKR